MIPRYRYDKCVEMLMLGYTLRVSRTRSRTARSEAYITTTDGTQALGRVLAETRNRLLDEAPLVLKGRGLWGWDYSQKGVA